MLRNVLSLAALLVLTLPAAPGAQQFGGPRRVEVTPAYPYTAIDKWTFGDGGSCSVGTAFLDIARGIGGQQFYPYLLDYAKHHPCEAVR